MALLMLDMPFDVYATLPLMPQRYATHALILMPSPLMPPVAARMLYAAAYYADVIADVVCRHAICHAAAYAADIIFHADATRH